MDKVEKVARAIYDARGAHEPPRAWRKWEGIGDEARAVWCQCATAALSAAHAEPVAWMRDWAAKGIDVMSMPIDDRPSGWSYQSVTQDKLFKTDVPLYASPRPEAVREALPRDTSRFRKMSDKDDETAAIRGGETP